MSDYEYEPVADLGDGGAADASFDNPLDAAMAILNAGELTPEQMAVANEILGVGEMAPPAVAAPPAPAAEQVVAEDPLVVGQRLASDHFQTLPHHMKGRFDEAEAFQLAEREFLPQAIKQYGPNAQAAKAALTMAAEKLAPPRSLSDVAQRFVSRNGGR